MSHYEPRCGWVAFATYMTLAAFGHDNTIIKFRPKILLSFLINGRNRINPCDLTIITDL